MPADGITRLVDFARHHGVIVGRSGGGRHLGSTIVLSPPLVITRAEIDRVVAVLDDAIADWASSSGPADVSRRPTAPDRGAPPSQGRD